MNIPKYIRFKGATYRRADLETIPVVQVPSLESLVTVLKRGVRFSEVFPQLFLGLRALDLKNYTREVGSALSVLTSMLESLDADPRTDIEPYIPELTRHLEAALRYAAYDEQKGPILKILRYFSSTTKFQN